MSTLPILSTPHLPTLSILTSSTYRSSLYTQTLVLSQTLGFCSPKSLRTLSSLFRVSSFKIQSSPYPVESRLYDAEEEDEDEDDDDDVAADEYEDISGDVSDGVEQSDDEAEISVAATEVPMRHEEFKWQRVEKLNAEVREFGEDIIDVDELASIYDFRIDKFQVCLCAFSYLKCRGKCTQKLCPFIISEFTY